MGFFFLHTCILVKAGWNFTTVFTSRVDYTEQPVPSLTPGQSCVWGSRRYGSPILIFPSPTRHFLQNALLVLSVSWGGNSRVTRDIGNQETDLKNKGMRMALLVTNSSPAVERRAGNTSSQTEETFILLSSRGNSTEFSPEKVET